MTHIEQYQANQEEFDYYIKLHVNGNTPKLQVSSDKFKYIIPEFIKSNPGVNIYGCQSCILDMLVWVKGEWKETLKLIEVVDLAQETETFDIRPEHIKATEELNIPLISKPKNKKNA